VAEGARLESVYTGNRIVGSNPTPSAIGDAVIAKNTSVSLTYLDRRGIPANLGQRFDHRRPFRTAPVAMQILALLRIDAFAVARHQAEVWNDERREADKSAH
jgi:hypothetical protein